MEPSVEEKFVPVGKDLEIEIWRSASEMARNLFGRTIESARIQMGRTQDGLCKDLKVDVEWWKKMEAGLRLPRQEESYRVVGKFLGISHSAVLVMAAPAARHLPVDVPDIMIELLASYPSQQSNHESQGGLDRASFPGIGFRG